MFLEFFLHISSNIFGTKSWIKKRRHSFYIQPLVYKKTFLQSDCISTLLHINFWKKCTRIPINSLAAQKKFFVKYNNILTYLDSVANMISDDVWFIRFNLSDIQQAMRSYKNHGRQGSLIPQGYPEHNQVGF